MGRDTVHFQCHHCSHCCTEVVCLPTPHDVIQLVKAVRVSPRRFIEFIQPDEVVGVDDNDPTWLEVNGNRYIMALKRTAKGCYFLNKRSFHCKAYEARPLLCRLYPFKLHESRQGEFKGFSLHRDVGCPRHRDGQVPTAPLYELYQRDCDHQQDYNDLVAVFNRCESPKKKPADFLDMFVHIEADERSR